METAIINATEHTSAITNSCDKFGNLYGRFIDYVDASPKTIATYKQNLRPFIAYLRAHGLTNPDRETVRSYRDALMDLNGMRRIREAMGCENLDKVRPAKESTVKAYMAVVKVFFSWLEDEGIHPNVTRHIKSPKVQASHTSDFLTATQAAQLLESIKRTHGNAARRDYIMCNLALALGLRTVEIERANIEHLHQVDGHFVLDVQGKGSKIVPMRIDDGVAAMLMEYLQSRGDLDKGAPLFVATSNHQAGDGRIPAKSISRIIKSHMVNAGIESERITAHSLRHTAAMLKLRTSNGNLKATQEFLRHSDPKTTMIYLQELDTANDTSSADVMRMIRSAAI